MRHSQDSPSITMTTSLGQDALSPQTSALPEEKDKSFARLAESEVGHVDQSDSLTPRRVMVLIAMAFMWTGSQIPLFFYGGLEPKVLADIGGYESAVWIVLGNLVPLAIVTPMVGSLADIFGRKSLGLLAFVLIMVGDILCATAKEINIFIVGSVLMGVGGGIGELIAIAVTGEIAPPRKRGFYVFAIVLSILPFCPAVLYGQLMEYASTWRWVGLLIGAWCFVGFMLTAIFYKPPPRPTAHAGQSRMELMRQIDYVGSLLSGGGLTLFLLGLSFATGSYAWTDAIVLAPFFIGILLMILFVVWETRYVTNPMFPARLKQHPRTLTIVLLITFVSGANYFACLVYWPTQYQILYAENDPVSQSLASMPFGFGVIAGSLIATFLLSLLKGRIRLLMIVSTVIMTGVNGAMACANLDNLSILWPIVAIASIGIGATIVPLQVVAGLICPPDLIGTITAVTIAMRVIGGSIAYAVYYNVFLSKFRSLIPTVIAPAAAQVGINSTVEIGIIAEVIQGGGFALLPTLPGITGPEQVEVLTHAGKMALAQAFPLVYYISIAFGATAIVASFFLTSIEEVMKGGAVVAM